MSICDFEVVFKVKNEGKPHLKQNKTLAPLKHGKTPVKREPAICFRTHGELRYWN